MNVAHFLIALRQESDSRAYIRRIVTRLRLLTHDASAEGRRPVTLTEFLDEVELILAERNLP